ncbi:hypothetical protein GGTG_08984 [Gaeumannomyces tritici R3-111a-1]|uniref:Uncharacterized protein n=1 Tax=Gaeumannomyces tritici (strain R3-111a-1) TaxID=644352 RepID=J3P643_GAET3|nr:hypothetical protein GGTG_08984 [Gaeumannomyces tritici R3-111a-1]EJT72116.1 hypothetical protein GGTG_08984 [Gaeumannomyces tritici R3-111a-1]
MARIAIPSRAAAAAPFQSRDALVRWLEASTERADGKQPIGDPGWSNKDLEPTPPMDVVQPAHVLVLHHVWHHRLERRRPGLIATGLTWQQAFISCIVGALLASCAVVAIARPGAMYHIGYPVLARSVIGMYDAYFFVFIRAVVCIIWYGIQTYYGGNLLSVCFRCIFGDA